MSLQSTHAATAPVTTKVGVTNTNVVKNGLVGHWTFDGKNMTNATATDMSGNGNHGTLTNMTTRSSATQGKIGQALKFDGVDDSVLIPTLQNLTSSASLAAWVKIGSTQGSYGGDLARGVPGLKLLLEEIKI